MGEKLKSKPVKKALCIISGGMDSMLCAYLAKKSGYEVVGLHFNYNQRTQDKELWCFEQICASLNVSEKYVLNADFIAQIGGNSLTDTSLKIAKNSLENHSQKVVPNTYVPFRNGIFLSIAASLAEKCECKAIYIGVTQPDNSGYPDCNEGFIKKAQKFINKGRATKIKTKIKTPLVKLTKAQIIALALRENVPLELSWSCYENSDEACGQCDSCLLRLKGFKKAGFVDKIKYKAGVN